MDGWKNPFITQGTHNPHQTVVWGEWVGDYRESKLEVLGYLSDDMRILVSYEWVINFLCGATLYETISLRI